MRRCSKFPSYYSLCYAQEKKKIKLGQDQMSGWQQKLTRNIYTSKSPDLEQQFKINFLEQKFTLMT